VSKQRRNKKGEKHVRPGRNGMRKKGGNGFLLIAGSNQKKGRKKGTAKKEKDERGCKRSEGQSPGKGKTERKKMGAQHLESPLACNQRGAKKERRYTPDKQKEEQDNPQKEANREVSQNVYEWKTFLTRVQVQGRQKKGSEKTEVGKPHQASGQETSKKKKKTRGNVRSRPVKGRRGQSRGKPRGRKKEKKKRPFDGVENGLGEKKKKEKKATKE